MIGCVTRQIRTPDDLTLIVDGWGHVSQTVARAGETAQIGRNAVLPEQRVNGLEVCQNRRVVGQALARTTDHLSFVVDRDSNAIRVSEVASS